MAEAWRLALARPERETPAGKRQRLQDQAVVARSARAEQAKRQQADADAKRAAPPERVEVAVLALLRAAQLLRMRAPSLTKASVVGLVKLAMSPRVRGSGPAVSHVRKLQNIGAASVGKLALDRQATGLAQWVGRASASSEEHTVKGLIVMWDEATQKTRALLEKKVSPQVIARDGRALGTAPKDVQVLVVLAAVSQVTHDGGVADGDRWEWQPWLCPPLFATSTRAPVLVEGLGKVLLVRITDKASVAEFCKGSALTICCFSHDMASSNVAAIEANAEKLELGGAACDSFLLHPERCLTHQIHIVKSACLALSGTASMLYSLSRIMANNSALNGICTAVRKHVEGNLVVKFGEAKVDDGLCETILGIWGADGDDSQLRQGGKETPFLNDIRMMCERSLFERESGKWVFLAPATARRHFGEDDKAKAVDFICAPLLKVLLYRRWETAALSRSLDRRDVQHQEDGCGHAHERHLAQVFGWLERVHEHHRGEGASNDGEGSHGVEGRRDR